MTDRPGLVRCVLLLPLVVLLDACWMSEHPLIDRSHAARVPIEGTYRSQDPAETETFRVVAAGDGYLIDDGKEGQRVLLARVRDDWVIAQWELEKARDERLYSLIEVGAERLTIHDTPCDESLDGFPGIARKDRTCTFETYAALDRAADQAIRRIESGTMDDDPAVLLRQR